MVMKLIIFLALALGELAISQAQECCVDTYEHVNYEGRHRRYCGEASWEKFFSKNFNDVISSIRVPNCCAVKLFENAHYQGRELFLRHDEPNFNNRGFNDMASSLKTWNFPCRR